MRWKSSSYGLLHVLFLVYSVNAAVINLKQGDACANVCSGKENLFKYAENQIYIYNFVSRHSIKNPNSKDETLQLELQGKAQISKISACDHGLMLSDVTMKQSLKEKSTMSKEYKMAKTMLEKTPLRFGFDNGQITGVCPDKDDSMFAVNIKKGILSSLQVSLDSFETPNYLTETDIAGECITEYIPKAEKPNFVQITKKKSIAGCSKKSKLFARINIPVYDEAKETRNLALLDGEYKCEIKVKLPGGIMESICEEKHIFKPFRSQTTGSVIIINQELKFASTKTGSIPAKIPTTRSDLTMNHGNKKSSQMKAKLPNPQSVLKEICTVVKSSIKGTKIAELFLSLIRSMSETTYKEIKALEKSITDDANCKEGSAKTKNILIDALTNVRTDAAFEFLINDAKIYKLTKLGLSVFDNPTPTMIALLTKKLDDVKSYNSITTILSSMIKSFCETNSGCMLNPDVTKAINGITKVLGSNCDSVDKNVRTKILYSLRAVGNAGSHPNIKTLVDILEACATRSANDDEVKILSVQAARQFPCNKDVDAFLWKIFVDISVTSELRIEAYLSLVRCPTRSTFEKIMKQLHMEKSQQLGSFVWSHISNLMETSDRFKIEQREMLQKFTIQMDQLAKKFNLDFRSYSKNIEKTFQRGSTAAKIDTNIIFSSSSPIPSSVTLNTTIDLFGRSVNIFEFGIRGKGISEKLFGGSVKPEAHINTHQDVVKMDKNIRNPSENLRVSLYTRFMGREIYFNPDIIPDLLNAMMKLQKTTAFERSKLLLDLTLSVASISGFPIELQLESAASIDLSMMKNDPIKLTEIELSTKMNLGIQVTGKMLVNAHCTKVGIQTKGLISRDMEVGGKLKLKDSPEGDLNDYQFELNKIPDNSKLFSISNELSLIHDLDKVQMVKAYSTKFEKCTGEGMLKIMGVKVCASLKEARTFSSLLPNIKAEVTIEKFSGLKIQWKKEFTLKPVKKLKSLLITTSFPGADEDTFRLKVERDSNTKRQLYEVLLWKKMIYLKFEIMDKKISGELKSGKNEAILSGSYESKTLFKSEMNVDIKSGMDTGKMTFSQQFTKAGPEIILKITKDGAKGFNLVSKTVVQMPEHKIFKKFEKFRHSTVLKYAGENEMSLIIDRSMGNKPPTEIKAKVEIFWKTKSKRNFYVSQNYFWQKINEDSNSALFGKVSGQKWIFNLNHEIEVKEKRYNSTNNIEYFISKNFGAFRKQPSLVYFKMKREDLVKKETVLDVSSTFGVDMSNMNDGKILLESKLNYKKDIFVRRLNSQLTWKLNKMKMYDIDAELIYAKFIELYFKHKFINSQKGITSLEIKVVDDSYKIHSELNLPKNHVLTISWPKSTIKIDSDVDPKSLDPFEMVVNHKLQMNNKLLAKIVNSVIFSSSKKELMINSIANSGTGSNIYNVKIERKLNYEITNTKVFYDYVSSTLVKIPLLDVDRKIEIEQYADVDIDGKIVIKDKTFVSKIIVSDKMKNRKYGYEINVAKKSDSVPYKKIKTMIFTGVSEDSVTVKFGRDQMSGLLGVFVDLKDKFVFEAMGKVIVRGKTANVSMLTTVNVRNNPKYNWYYKRNTVLNWETPNVISMKMTGELGKSRTDSDFVSYHSQLTLKYKEWKKLDIDFSLTCPHKCITLANLNYILTYNFENTDPEMYMLTFNNIIKWQVVGERTAKYYDLQSTGNYDRKNKKLEFDLTVAKDTNINKFVIIKLSKNSGKSGEVYVKLRENFVKCGITTKCVTENCDAEIKLKCTSSINVVKELTINLEKKNNDKTTSWLSNMAVKSGNTDYTLMVSRLKKADFQNKFDMVENIKWESNIEYIKSGAATLGLLNLGTTLQCNLNLQHDKKKIIDLKISTTSITSNLKIALETNIKQSFKINAEYLIVSERTKLKIEMELGDKFFKYSNDMTYKIVSTEYKVLSVVIVKTSATSFKQLEVYRNFSFDYNKIWKTFKFELESTLNGKNLLSCNIDLPNGIIREKNNLVKYIKFLNIQSYEVTLKYKFQSYQDFSIEEKLLIDDKMYCDLQLEYFRMVAGEQSKKIANLGDALFYLNIKMKREASFGKLNVFISKDKKSGQVKMQADIPKIGMKFSEVTMSFEDIKESDGSYTGKMKYKGNDYSFKYKTYVGYKRELQIKANTKDSVPQQMDLAFDFTKDYVFKVMFDQYFVLELNLLSTAKDEYAGNHKLVYKGTDIFKLKTKSTIKLPADVKKLSDFIQALLGVKIGLDLKYKISGNIMKKIIKGDMRLYHLHSEVFVKGGTKSYQLINLEISEKSTKKITILTSCDQKYPEFSYEDQITIVDDGVTGIKNSLKMVYRTINSMELDLNVFFKDFTMRAIGKNSDTMWKANWFYKIPSKQRGFGLETMKKTYETALTYISDTSNCTHKTNVLYLVHFFTGSMYTDLFPVGKKYYISMVDTIKHRSLSLQVYRTTKTLAMISCNMNLDTLKTDIEMKAYDQRSTNGGIGFVLDYSGSDINLKSFVFKADARFPETVYQMILTTNLKVNKVDRSDLVLKVGSITSSTPFFIEVDYRGTYLIMFNATLDIKKLKFSHLISVKDGKFKTLMWTAQSMCTIKSEVDCFYNRTNNARQIKLAIIWKRKINVLEFSWNKKKDVGYILSCERKAKKTIVTLSSPIRIIRLSRLAESVNGVKKRQIAIEFIRKADPTKPVTFNFDISKKGSNQTDYSFDISLNSNLLQKGLKLSVNSQFKKARYLYNINIKSSFDGEVKPFFTLDSSLEQLLSGHYQVKTRITNNEKFINISTTLIFNADEISVEYRAIQNDNYQKTLIFQFIPFKKLLITNEKDFTIMCTRTVYQYGYRRDMVFKLGKNGPNVVAYATLVKSPLKYKAEVSSNGRRFVVDFRPVGNLYLGDVYRKREGRKIQDLKLKMNLDSNNTMTTDLYWNPEFIESFKSFLSNMTKHENLKNLLVNSYENYQSRMSSFSSDMKTKLMKNINGVISLEYAKGIASDIENMPDIVGKSYDEDDLYMKTIMDKWRSFIKNRDIGNRFESMKNKFKMTSESLSTAVYNWFIEAKWYSIIYNPIKSIVGSITYDHVKLVINCAVNVGESIARCVNWQIEKIGNKLDILSERAKAVTSKVSLFKDGFVSTFNGSTVGQMFQLIREVREVMLEGLGQVVETEFIKQRIAYYNATISNVKDLVIMSKDMTKKMLKYIKTSNVVSNVMETVKLIKSMEYKEAFMNMIRPDQAKFEIDVDKGKMNMTLYVPPMAKPVYKMMRTATNWLPVQMMTRMRGSGLGEKLLTLFYRYEYLMFNYGSMKTLKKLLPPFKKSAWVINGNSILTYDGSSVRIGSGKCSYLLARDSKFGSFSLLMHIKSATEKKEFVLSYIKKITILSSGRVNVDDSPVDTLPTLLTDKKGRTVEISRDNDVTKIVTSEGLTVKYFSNLDYLKVVLNGNWHGMVKGLLGSNDFDSINDLRTSYGQITHDAGILSKSWSIDTCNSGTKTGLYSVRTNPSHLKRCSDLFKTNSMSYLSRCNSLINPEPYYELCRIALQYQQMTDKEFEAHICNLSRNYVIRCKTMGIMIRLDRSCVSCANDKFGKATSTILPKKSLKFNYIFIIEQSKCLLPYKSLVKKMVNVMALEKNNLYTLMTYNGAGIFKDAHFKTLKNNVTFEKDGFLTILKDLANSPHFGERYFSSTEGSQAIFDAIKMPSKPGYIEKIVFIGCSTCGEHKKYLFSTLAGLLKYSGISMNYLTVQQFTGPGSSVDTAGLVNNKIYYFDKDTLTIKNWAKDTQPPTDVCSNLAQINGGFIWSLNPMTTDNRMRRVSEILSNQLTVVNGVPKQKCTCDTGNYEEGKVECKVSGLV